MRIDRRVPEPTIGLPETSLERRDWLPLVALLGSAMLVMAGALVAFRVSSLRPEIQLGAKGVTRATAGPLVPGVADSSGAEKAFLDPAVPDGATAKSSGCSGSTTP